VGKLRIVVLLALAAAGALAAPDPKPKLEIFSARGNAKTVKLFGTETVVFFAREQSPARAVTLADPPALKGVTFRFHAWPRASPGTATPVRPRILLREVKPPPPRWGRAPDSFPVRGGSTPQVGSGAPLRPDQHPTKKGCSVGRYVLEATKPGYEKAEIVIHKAAFSLDRMKDRFRDGHYLAGFELSLVDLDEKGKAIPLRIETLSPERTVIDRRDDIVLAPLFLRPGEYRSSRRILITSEVTESMMDRVARREKAPLPPGYFERAALRVVEGGYLRLRFRNLKIDYPLPLGTTPAAAPREPRGVRPGARRGGTSR
jgi:hypothetical protein